MSILTIWLIPQVVQNIYGVLWGLPNNSTFLPEKNLNPNSVSWFVGWILRFGCSGNRTFNVIIIPRKLFSTSLSLLLEGKAKWIIIIFLPSFQSVSISSFLCLMCSGGHQNTLCIPLQGGHQNCWIMDFRVCRHQSFTLHHWWEE